MMITDLFVEFGIWSWFILGAVLLLIELLAPGMFMLWLGLAAFAVGAISLLIVWPWQAQLVAFALIALALIPLWRRLARSPSPTGELPFLNRRTLAMVGREFVLEQPIVGGTGSIRVGDTIWRVAGPDCPAGSRVRIAAADGAELTVEPVG